MQSICVECGAPATDVYKEYGGKGTGNIRLTRCESCHRLVDKYVEMELVIIFLDLLLLRPQVYRHLLFNRIPYREHGLDGNCLRIGMVYVLFEAGLKYFSGHHGHHINYPYLLGGQLAYEQYLYAVGITLVEYVAYLLAVVVSARLLLANTTHSAIKYNYLAMAVILSSFGKPLHIFLMVWDYQQLFSTILDVFVVISNIMAVRAFLNDARQAMLVVAVGFTVRLLTRLVLSAHHDSTVPFTFFIN